MAVQRKGLTLLEKNKMEEDNDEMDLNDDVSDSESEPESEPESDSEGEDVKLTEPAKNAIYNTEGLLDKLGDISWSENVDWLHKLSVEVEQEQEVDVNDDLTREMAFYNQALQGTKRAFERLQSKGLPFLRPADYYAEMVKTDSHMEKVKGRLLVEKRKIEEAEERRKARESKRLAKEIQAQKQKERAKQKKEEIESVKKWRKQRQQSGFAKGDGDGEPEFSFEDGKSFERSGKKRPGVGPGDRSGGRMRQGGGKGKLQKKREFKNSKFGFGGRKALKKQNSAETTGEFGGFNKGNKAGNKRRKV